MYVNTLLIEMWKFGRTTKIRDSYEYNVRFSVLIFFKLMSKISNSVSDSRLQRDLNLIIQTGNKFFAYPIRK
jgi:hypothetical protein